PGRGRPRGSPGAPSCCAPGTRRRTASHARSSILPAAGNCPASACGRCPRPSARSRWSGWGGGGGGGASAPAGGRGARRRRSLARGPALHAILLRLRADEHLLVVVVHHIAADHWAITVALRELSALYAAAAAGRAVDLPP